MPLSSVRDRLANASSLGELYSHLDQAKMMAGWNKTTPSLWPEPRETFLPAHWRYAEARAALDAAGSLISTADAERRNLVLINPLPGNNYSTTRTIVAAYQMLKPGEVARSHRHVPNALRLIVDAEPGAYSIVDGQKVPMTTGDVVLTPNWSWHGHGNEGTHPAYWIDVLDVPLVHILEPMFFEPHPQHYEPVQSVPADSPMRFARSRTRTALADAAVKRGMFGPEISLDSGVLQTLALRMIDLEPGKRSATLRITANRVYCVVEGTGTTFVGEQRFDWAPGDVIAVPSWHSHSHQARGAATLLLVSDEPVMAKLGFLRQELRTPNPAEHAAAITE